MKFLSLNLIGFFLLITINLQAQKLMEIKPKSPVICYKSFVDKHTYTPPSEKFLRSRQNPSGRTKTATFIVDYIGFPNDEAARDAFQYAIDIWETELKSDVPIRVRAQWGPLGQGVLGQAIWGTAYAN